MANQNTLPPLELVPRSAPLPSIRALGEEFARMVRADVRRTGQRTPNGRFPQPASTLYELGRDDADVRGLSLATVGSAIAVLAQASAVEPGAVEAMFIGWMAWALALAPEAANCYPTEWARETRQGAETDVAQARALPAVETLDLPSIDQAQAEIREHIARLLRCDAALSQQRRVVQAARADRRRGMHA